MNKNILWTVLAVVIIGLVFWLGSGSKNVDNKNIETATTTDSTNVKTGVKVPVSSKPVTNTVKNVSFTNILPRVGNYQCDYDSVTQQERTANTIYLSDGKMRAEFRTIKANGSIANIMVYDGSYLYVWTEGKSTGTVTQPKSISDFPTIIPKEILSSTSLGSGLNSASWSCHPWSVDKTMLAKPSYLKV